MHDEKTLEYVDGTAVHWYSFDLSPFEVMDFAKSPKKDLLLMNTEGGRFVFFNNDSINMDYFTGYIVTRPYLGDWDRASNYAKVIMEVNIRENI